MTTNHPMPSPAESMARAMDIAHAGGNPSLSTDALLASLELDGDQPDGRTLMQRFTQDKADFGTLRSVLSVMHGSEDLLRATNERTANPAQEALAKTLGQVVTRQIEREGDICDGARSLVLACERDDIISPEIRASMDPFAGLSPEQREALQTFMDVVVIAVVVPPVPRQRGICGRSDSTFPDSPFVL